MESTQDGVKKWRPVSKCFRWIQQGVKLDFTIVCMLHHHFHPIRILLYHHFHPCRRLRRDHQFGLGFDVVIIIVVIVINVVIIYLQLGFMKTLRWICVGVLSTPPHPNLASWYTLTLSSSSMLQSMLQPIVIGHYRFHFKWPCHSPLSLLRRVQSKRSRVTSSSQLLHIGCHLHQWRFETQFWSKIVPHECLTNQT